jgi:hypothetical protein
MTQREVKLMLICSLFIMGHWLKRGSLSEQCNATKENTGVTDDVRRSQRFTLPSIIGQF